MLQLRNLQKIRDSGGYGILLYPEDFEGFTDFVDHCGYHYKWYETNIRKQRSWTEKLTGGNMSKETEIDKIKEENQKVLDNKKFVVDALLATGREGMESLVAFMDEIGFFSAPCSGGNHLCCEFGLVHHTRNVMMAAEDIGYALLGKTKYAEIRNSVMIAAALHDLGKCGDHGKQMYVPNILKSGKQSDAKPYKRNPDLLPLDHATRSVKLATLFIDLTEEEEYAIRYHDGLYETANYGVKNHETPLYLILHYADLWSSRVTEGGVDSGESENE